MQPKIKHLILWCNTLVIFKTLDTSNTKTYLILFNY